MVDSKFIGLFPAAGTASRLNSVQALPCSKEIMLVGNVRATTAVQAKPGRSPSQQAVGDYLMHQFRSAGISDVAVIIREGKEDIVEHYQQDSFYWLNLLVTTVKPTPSPVHSIAAARASLRNAHIALGFPDIILSPNTMIAEIREHLLTSDCEVVLATMPVSQCSKYDMVLTQPDSTGLRVRDITIKPESMPDNPSLPERAWLCAAWTPAFSALLFEFVRQYDRNRQSLPAASSAGSDALHIGHVLLSAIAAGMRIDAIDFADGRVLDIGTPESLALATSVDFQQRFFEQ